MDASAPDLAQLDALRAVMASAAAGNAAFDKGFKMKLGKGKGKGKGRKGKKSKKSKKSKKKKKKSKKNKDSSSGSEDDGPEEGSRAYYKERANAPAGAAPSRKPKSLKKMLFGDMPPTADQAPKASESASSSSESDSDDSDSDSDAESSSASTTSS